MRNSEFSHYITLMSEAAFGATLIQGEIEIELRIEGRLPYRVQTLHTFRAIRLSTYLHGYVKIYHVFNAPYGKCDLSFKLLRYTHGFQLRVSLCLLTFGIVTLTGCDIYG